MSKQIKCSLPDELAAGLEKVAKYNRMSMSALVRHAVLAWMRRYKNPAGMFNDAEKSAIRGRK